MVNGRKRAQIGGNTFRHADTRSSAWQLMCRSLRDIFTTLIKRALRYSLSALLS